MKQGVLYLLFTLAYLAQGLGLAVWVSFYLLEAKVSLNGTHEILIEAIVVTIVTALLSKNFWNLIRASIKGSLLLMFASIAVLSIKLFIYKILLNEISITAIVVLIISSILFFLLLKVRGVRLRG